MRKVIKVRVEIRLILQSLFAFVLIILGWIIVLNSGNFYQLKYSNSGNYYIYEHTLFERLNKLTPNEIENSIANINNYNIPNFWIKLYEIYLPELLIDLPFLLVLWILIIFIWWIKRQVKFELY